MNTSIQSHGFKADEKLNSFVEKKLEKLPTYYDKIVDVEVKMTTDSHQKVKEKVVNILCNVPGKSMFAEAKARTFEEATDEAINDMVRQLKKKKVSNKIKIKKELYSENLVNKSINNNLL